MNKQSVLNNLKNLIGWRTPRKLVVFSVDDYGNVRLDSKRARLNLDQAGLKVRARFDAYDTLETKEDLLALYDTLSSVKDQHGRAAVFTPFALPCNIDFEEIASQGYERYRYETLPVTYEKLSDLQPKAYTGAWPLWQEGVSAGLLRPQFHGREHLNLKVFTEKLRNKDPELMTVLANRSYTSISSTGYPSISYTAAYSFWSPEELEPMREVLQTGLKAFEAVYGYAATAFTPPAQQFHKSLEPTLWGHGVSAIDKPLSTRRHQGNGNYQREINFTSRQKSTNTATLVRNVVFEPTDERGVDWVAFTMQQIEAAFRWHRPAIISSHRVNFCGHIDPKNRQQGLAALGSLLQRIVQRWPDVEFISVGELVPLIGKA